MVGKEKDGAVLTNTSSRLMFDGCALYTCWQSVFFSCGLGKHVMSATMSLALSLALVRLSPRAGITSSTND